MFRTFITLKALKQRKTAKQKLEAGYIDVEEDNKITHVQEGN